NIWQTPISSTPDSKPGRYSGRGDVASRPAIKSGIAVVACLHCAVADLFGDAEAFAQVAGVGAGAVSAGGAAQHLA
ncbi:hypothetical protein ABQF61_18690, partial [Xanthomonas campestris]|uniref:hypothetical protein n=1 Tax=Xanthomonas campestris TaxID=339 RepID=UPI002B36CE39|nr:hypothetical protein [Xanthomonas campestris]MEA9668926.1 hypothetical protein [Xanthomonas campestris]MEA9704572.1 hypothetical protein [Xanthomonas campestris]MEA9716097.1 hypothetical protein [Xanthomonas campestris]